METHPLLNHIKLARHRDRILALRQLNRVGFVDEAVGGGFNELVSLFMNRHVPFEFHTAVLSIIES